MTCSRTPIPEPARNKKRVVMRKLMMGTVAAILATPALAASGLEFEPSAGLMLSATVICLAAAMHRRGGLMRRRS